MRPRDGGGARIWEDVVEEDGEAICTFRRVGRWLAVVNRIVLAENGCSDERCRRYCRSQLLS